MNKKNEKGSFEKIQIIKPKENEKIIEIGKDLAINNNMNVLENKSSIKKKISKLPKKIKSSRKEKKYNYLLNIQNIINKGSVTELLDKDTAMQSIIDLVIDGHLSIDAVHLEVILANQILDMNNIID